MEAIKKIEANKIVKIILIAIAGTLLLTISAKIKIPFYRLNQHAGAGVVFQTQMEQTA